MRPILFEDTCAILVYCARIHCDANNSAAHMIGVPMIVFGIGMMLARAMGWPGDPGRGLAWLVWGQRTLCQVSCGHPDNGVTVSLINAASTRPAHLASGGSIARWFTRGLALVLAGCILPLLSHHDVRILLVGPRFNAAEGLFALQLADPMTRKIEPRTGPWLSRDQDHPSD